jgi:hypothetical protein
MSVAHQIADCVPGAAGPAHPRNLPRSRRAIIGRQTLGTSRALRPWRTGLACIPPIIPIKVYILGVIASSQANLYESEQQEYGLKARAELSPVVWSDP